MVLIAVAIEPVTAAAPTGGSRGPGRDRVRLAGSQPQRLERLAGPLRSTAAELPGQLLQSMPDEQRADDDAQQGQSESHGVLLGGAFRSLLPQTLSPRELWLLVPLAS